MLDSSLNDEITDFSHQRDNPHWLAVIHAVGINQTEQMHQKGKLML